MITKEFVNNLTHRERMEALGATVRARMEAVTTVRLDHNGNDMNYGKGFLSDTRYSNARSNASMLRY